MSDPRMAAVPTTAGALTVRQRRQIAGITLAAIGTFVLLRWLPTGTNLSHMDFRVDAKNSIDFCDPLNPQFIPVVAVASPVSMAFSGSPALAGREVTGSVTLTTASGKPIAPEDLLVVHTERLHLLIVDPSLQDYQHVHPTPGRRPGAWDFRFTPRRAGAYRIFADFTPAATARGLYASTDLTVSGPRGAAEGEQQVGGPAPGLNTEQNGDGYRFRLEVAGGAIQPRVPADLRFSIVSEDGGDVPLEPVMGAFAHLVAFDQTRSGFAHLHPMQTDLTQRPDPVHPALDFKITIPTPGRYVIWAQVNLGGTETFVPFWFDVGPAVGGSQG